MQERLKTFYFLQGVGILLWVYMYLTWIFDLPFMVVRPFAVSAILVNFLALAYAIFRLDRKSMPRTEVIGGNLWVTADSLWAIGDIGMIYIIVIVARIFAVLMAIIATGQFLASKDNTDKLRKFSEVFTKFRRM